MSQRRKERHGIGMNSYTEHDNNPVIRGTSVSTPTGPFKDGISEAPANGGNAAYPKQGRINFGKDKLDVVP